MLSGTFGESDLVHNGTSLWAWNSKAKTATHATLPSRSSATRKTTPKTTPKTDLPNTPQERGQAGAGRGRQDHRRDAWSVIRWWPARRPTSSF